MWSAEKYVEALQFAADRHAGQKVPGTERPYLVHLTSVAQEVMRGIALESVPDPDLAVVCAVLHDVVEDTGTTAAEVAARFGDAVARGVAALSKDAGLPKGEQGDDSLRRIRECPREVWCVKLADRITNLDEPPPFWTVEKRRGYREEARRIHAALGAAHEVLGERLAERIERYARFVGGEGDGEGRGDVEG
jgi:(p)ppGpp synthase/HD superfamily hydrolase